MAALALRLAPVLPKNEFGRLRNGAAYAFDDTAAWRFPFTLAVTPMLAMPIETPYSGLSNIGTLRVTSQDSHEVRSLPLHGRCPQPTAYTWLSRKVTPPATKVPLVPSAIALATASTAVMLLPSAPA